MKILKHKRSMDIAVEVISDMERTDGWFIKGRWVNLGWVGEPFYIDDETVDILIQWDKVSDWEDITDHPKRFVCGL